MTVEKILQKAAKEIYHFRHPSIFSLLVSAVFKWIINSRLGVRFLHFAAEKNFYNIIRFLVKHGANVDAADREGNTVLHVASIFGFIEIVQTVAARTENINVYNIYGNTPLHFSIKYKQLYAMQRLLRYGADINVRSEVMKS